MKKKRKNTLRNRVFIALICIVIVQCLVFTSVILLTGTLQELDESRNTIFENTVTKNAETLENYMIGWSQIDDYQSAVEQVITKLAKENNQEISQYMQEEASRKEALNQVSEILLEHLRNLSTTGCFIILDDGEVGTSKNAIVLRDLDPQNHSVNNYDILVEAGYSKWMLEQGLTLDSSWTEKLSITEDSDFYYKPFNAGNEYTQIQSKDLGYYSKEIRFHTDDIQVITYTRPLLDENHHSYGVIGVEVTESYIQYILSKMGVGIDSGHYYIGVTQDGENYETVVVRSGQYQSLFKSLDTVVLKEGKRFFHIEDTEDVDLEMSLYQCKLYNTNTPFEDEQWVIGGFIESSVLTEASRKLIARLELSTLVSLLVCVIGALLLTHNINKPIKILLAGIEKNSKSEIELPRTNMKEFDELAREIEKRTHEVYRAGSKVADIIAMANINLGVVEYINDSTEMFCNKELLEMFHLPLVGWHDNYVPKEKNLDIIEGVLRTLVKETEEENIYWCKKDNGEKFWVRLEEVVDEERRLCVFMDVTDSMKEKKKITHDRDYDVLTDIYNRRAFARIVEGILSSGECENGVLTVWDLDHLKYVNDTYGHDMGDKYITTMAHILGFHNYEYYIAARMAGDEFITFIYNDELENLYQQMREIHKKASSQEIVLPDGKKMVLSVSAGMAAYKQDATTYKGLADCADSAMYHSKKAQRGNIKAFEEN